MTFVLAMSQNEGLWTGTLVAGLIVALVVWGLLEHLRRSVNAVEPAVERVWLMGKRVAQNTSTSYLLQTTKERGGELLEELDQHRAPTERSGP